MEQNTLYTAIGRLDRETNGCGRSCPVIRLGGQTYMVDMQEMVVWTALNWRISKREDISLQCDKLVSSLGDCISRSWDACVNRLLTRGLLVSGCGETEYDALYDFVEFSRHYSSQRINADEEHLICQTGGRPPSPYSTGAKIIPKRPAYRL